MKDTKEIPVEETQIKKDLGNFPFSTLWEDESETSLVKYVPILNAILIFIAIIMLWKK